MIEKITMYDKKVEKSGFSGRTLDLSGGKRKRAHTSRKPRDPDACKEGKSTPKGAPMSKHKMDYAQFINCLR